MTGDSTLGPLEEMPPLPKRRRRSVDRRHWNKGEEIRWWRFFMGLEATHPGDRSLDAARQHLHPYCLYELTTAQWHASYVAASKFFPAIKQTRENIRRMFAEDVQRLAVRMEGHPRVMWPEEAFLGAILAARQAIYRACPHPNAPPIDNPNATR